jgi:hypothetical protein
LQGWRGFRKVKTVVRGVQKHFTAQNTNTWLRTGVRQANFGRGILKNLVPKKLG